MKLFRCQACDNSIYFENRTCGRCGHRLGYVPELEIMAALEPAGGDGWTPLAGERSLRRFCANAAHDVCNWLTAAGGQERLCVACRHNAIIPDISRPSHLAAWRDIELAKHRLFYGRPGQRLVGYDNERGKGDHRHLGDKPESCAFSTPEQLIEDFLADVGRLRGDS